MMTYLVIPALILCACILISRILEARQRKEESEGEESKGFTFSEEQIRTRKRLATIGGAMLGFAIIILILVYHWAINPILPPLD